MKIEHVYSIALYFFFQTIAEKLKSISIPNLEW